MTPAQSDLRAARKALGLTCQAAADLVGVDLSRLSNYAGRA